MKSLGKLIVTLCGLHLHCVGGSPTTPTFNITEFIGLCKQDNVKYVFTYENGGVVPYFNTTLNLHQIYEQIYDSGNFSQISPDATFGSDPRRILILNFTG